MSLTYAISWSYKFGVSTFVVTFKKNATKPKPPKSVLLVKSLSPFKQWALDVVRPMSENKRGKRF